MIECVPNFSEGQRKEVIEAIANSIATTDGCNLLDVDPGLSTNRTVYTFVGSPEAVVEGALNGARVAAQLIDLRRHHGEHPRIGVMDVCPFIPVRGVTMEDCVKCANEFAERLASELLVPVYLYGEAATEDYRKTVPQIRAGEYEGLPEKLLKPEWKPNYGPAEFVPNWGATLVGARKFLIAYNVNLLSTKEQAHRIALDIREQGRGSNQPGRLKCVQAIGWYLEEANMAQVSVNISDHEVTPIHVVYEEICKEARELGLAVVGSQVVGLVPLKAMLQTAAYYSDKENLFLLEEDQKIRLVVDRLGLHSVGTFNPKERIIEYMVDKERDGPLISMDVKDFILTVGARSPTPGGGSVAALTATLGAALGAMVGFLTYGNKKFHHLDGQMRRLLEPLYRTMKELMPFVDADAMAFSDYMDLKEMLPYMDADVTTFSDYSTALKVTKSGDEEEKVQEDRIKQSLLATIAVPMKLATTANSLWPTLKELAAVANIACKSDLQVGVKSIETGVWGAYHNVLTNLKDLKDEDLNKKFLAEAAAELKTAQDGCAEVLAILDGRMTDV
jgi:glutamate formiminotransferase/formiminotetrahydrofolate cyclodeaminase